MCRLNCSTVPKFFRQSVQPVMTILSFSSMNVERSYLDFSLECSKKFGFLHFLRPITSAHALGAVGQLDFAAGLKSVVRYCEVFPHSGHLIPVLLRTLGTGIVRPHFLLLHCTCQPFSAAVIGEILSWQPLLDVRPAR
jgi:hypothetical protein